MSVQRKSHPKRQPGALEGKIWMAEDFDVFPDETLSALEGEKLDALRRLRGAQKPLPPGFRFSRDDAHED